jgi:hypothetical protein
MSMTLSMKNNANQVLKDKMKCNLNFSDLSKQQFQLLYCNESVMLH